MTKEILINVGLGETRVAFIDKGMLEDISIVRHQQKKSIGNIYKGRVLRVVPGLNAAFIDIGFERSAFLSIDEMPLSEGDNLIVQVIKEPIGSKGAVVSTDLSLSSVSLIYKPHDKTVNISSKIQDNQERERLLQIINAFNFNQGGFIIRTAAEGRTEQQMLFEAESLIKAWSLLKIKMNTPKGCLLYEDWDIPYRILREKSRTFFHSIKVDDEQEYIKLMRFAENYLPELKNKISYYRDRVGLFEQFQIENLIENALHRRVDLKEGAYLVIDTTEAMTVIDVNSGSFTGYKNNEFGLLQVNLEAARVIAQQVRLRNLAGIIIIDFINMQNKSHQEQVVNRLKIAFMNDNLKTSIGGITSLGLVEISRQRKGESLLAQLCETCPLCQHRGVVKSIETIAYEIFRKIIKYLSHYDIAGLLVIAEQSVIHYLSKEGNELKSLSQLSGKTIQLKQAIHHNQEHYEIILLNEAIE